jgi:hypothetical protein
VIVCTVTMLGLKPWEPDESVPRLAQPALEARVGNAVALPTVGPAVAVVEAAVAPGKAKLISRPSKGTGEGEGPESAPAVGPALAVSAGRKAAAAPEPAPLPESPPMTEVPPVAAPAPELASVPATPASSSPAAKTPNGPVSAGGPESPGEAEEEPSGEEPDGEEPGEGGEEACAGDEYTLTITPLEAESEAVTIVLEHVVADGSTETLELEGDLEDARSLVLKLSSEGGCVEVEVVSPVPTAP